MKRIICQSTECRWRIGCRMSPIDIFTEWVVVMHLYPRYTTTNNVEALCKPEIKTIHWPTNDIMGDYFAEICRIKDSKFSNIRSTWIYILFDIISSCIKLQKTFVDCKYNSFQTFYLIVLMQILMHGKLNIRNFITIIRFFLLENSVCVQCQKVDLHSLEVIQES